ncbi:hypothetical protein ANN_20563 [Periplaneta americana]|uniref:Uncharacterized protein n=1 Tax=Periplaneta americana TaxID=6978 RepID=A0ABQ8SD17_PERAM|nr:hypothetical protein ANN_20563 [Periplaneta americana]
MSPGSSTESYPAFARIELRKNPGKNLNQVTCPDRDSNPGHLVSRPDALTVTPQFIDYFCPHLWSNGQRVWLRNQVARVRIPVGARGQIPWPPRSPDLNPLDFTCGGISNQACMLNPSRTCRHWNNTFALPVTPSGCSLEYLNVCDSLCYGAYTHAMRPVVVT